MPGHQRPLGFSSLLAMLLAALLSGCESAEPSMPPLTVVGRTMGTTYSAKWIAGPGTPTSEVLQAELDRRLERISDQMSTYRPASELSKFNAWQSNDWFAVSPETAMVVAEAQRIHRLTDGAFDVTVGPLVNLWSFGPEARPEAVPTDEEIAARKAAVGSDKLDVRTAPPALRKSRPDVSVDLSAIAKGFGVDQMAACLESIGIQNYMVEIGGEVRTKGSKSDGSAWKIGIETPVGGRRNLQKVVALDGQSLATSGDYRNYFEQDGRRYSHTIDPRTGRPIEHALASVSVVAETCMTADGLATALMVLGPERAYNFAQEENLAVLLIVHDGERFVETLTPGFARLTVAPARNAEARMNWTILLAAIAVFAVAFALMAVGVIFSNRRIKGSCGGLANLKDEQGRTMCEACTNPAPTCRGVDEASERAVR